MPFILGLLGTPDPECKKPLSHLLQCPPGDEKVASLNESDNGVNESCPCVPISLKKLGREKERRLGLLPIMK